MKAVFFELEEFEKQYVPEVKKTLKFKTDFYVEALTMNTVSKAKDAEIISVFICSKINKEILDKLPKVKLIATRSTGFDHIDVKECKKRGIIVCNVPSYGENTVAEHTFGLILALSRKIYQAISRTKHDDFSSEGLTGFDLKGKTLGVVGVGKIGVHVIRMAKGFEMNVIAFNQSRKKDLEKELGYKAVSFDQLLKQADVITFHVPLTPETTHMINKKNISKIKKGAILVNTARGPIIETEAILEALNKGILSAVGLDVLEEENAVKEEKEILSGICKPSGFEIKTIMENHILMHKENVLITPHNAFNSREAIKRILDTTVESIVSFSKKKPINTVS